MTDAQFELMMRHGDDFSPAPMWHDGFIDLRRPKKSYLAVYGKEKFETVASQMIRKVIVDSLHDAGLQPDDPGSSTSCCHGSERACWTPSTTRC